MNLLSTDSICMFDRTTKPPVLVGKKFKDKGSTFVVKSSRCQRKCLIISFLAPWYRRRAKIVGEASITGRVFLYASLLEMVGGCFHTLQKLNYCQSFVWCSLRLVLCLCPNIIQAICKCWRPETNSLHTSKGEVSIPLLDIHISSCFYFWAFFMMKLLLHTRTLRLVLDIVTLICLQPIIICDDALITNQP